MEARPGSRGAGPEAADGGAGSCWAKGGGGGFKKHDIASCVKIHFPYVESNILHTPSNILHKPYVPVSVLAPENSLLQKSTALQPPCHHPTRSANGHQPYPITPAIPPHQALHHTMHAKPTNQPSLQHRL